MFWKGRRPAWRSQPLAASILGAAEELFVCHVPHLLPPPLCHQEFNYGLEKKEGRKENLFEGGVALKTVDDVCDC